MGGRFERCELTRWSAVDGEKQSQLGEVGKAYKCGGTCASGAVGEVKVGRKDKQPGSSQ